MPAKTKERVVDRALLLGILAFRARFEGARSEEAESMAEGATAWLREAGVIRHEAIQEEVLLFSIPALGWKRSVVLALQDAGLEDSLGALLFALGVVDAMPPYDAPFDAETVVRALPFLSDSPFVTHEGMSPAEERASMVAAVSLRRADRLVREEQRAAVYAWRSVSHSLVAQGRLDGRQLAGILRSCAAKARELGVVVDDTGELLVCGMRYDALDDLRAEHCARIAEARLRAFRWVLGDAPWDRVEMGT